MSCSAVVSPASPTTYAVPSGRWSARKSAVASAEVQIASSGTSMPLRSSRARRSRGVKIELLVSTRNFRPDALSASTNSVAPAIGSSSWTSTPSMSVSQVSTGRGISSGTRPSSQPSRPGWRQPSYDGSAGVQVRGTEGAASGVWSVGQVPTPWYVVPSRVRSTV